MVVVKFFLLLFDFLRNGRNDYGRVMINGDIFFWVMENEFQISILIPEKELALLIVLLKSELGYSLFL